MNGEFPNVQTKLLYFVVSCGYVSRKGLIPVAGNPAALSRGVGILCSHCYVKESTAIEVIKGKQQRKVVYYRPTQLGIDSLASQADNLPLEARWVRDLPARTKRSRIVKDDRISGRERMARYLQISTSASFAAVAGCNVKSIIPKWFGGDEKQTAIADSSGHRRWICEAGGNYIAKHEISGVGSLVDAKQEICETGKRANLLSTVRDITCSGADLEQNSNGAIMNKDSDVLFVDAYRVKDSLRKENVSLPVLRVGRYTGIVESPLKSVLLYVGTRRGMGWSNQAVGSDVQAYQAYVNRVSCYHSNRSGDWRGVLLVENAKMFDDIYKDRVGKRGKGEEFAKGFKEMLVFPMTEEGAILFEKYMTVDMVSPSQ